MEEYFAKIGKIELFSGDTAALRNWKDKASYCVATSPIPSDPSVENLASKEYAQVVTSRSKNFRNEQSKKGHINANTGSSTSGAIDVSADAKIVRQDKDKEENRYIYTMLGPLTIDRYEEPIRLRHRDFPRLLNRTKGLLPQYPSGYTFEYEYYRQYDIMMDRRKKSGAKVPDQKYYLSVLAIFKNEGHIIEEWLEHHIGHGVEHFYLIDDNSDDNAHMILESYIDKGLVTMFQTSRQDLKFRQGAMYQRVFHDVYTNNETYWLAIIDLDEFLYSPGELDVTKVLRRHEDLSVVGVNWLIFGSSGHKEQPQSVTQNFYHRAPENLNNYPDLINRYKVLAWSDYTNGDWQKSIVNTNHKVDQVDVHVAVVDGTADNLSIKRYPDNPPLLLNHYIVQSYEFFKNVKGRRGDVNNWFSDHARDKHYFKMCDINNIKDTRLKDMNIDKNIALPPYKLTVMAADADKDWWFTDNL